MVITFNDTKQIDIPIPMTNQTTPVPLSGSASAMGFEVEMLTISVRYIVYGWVCLPISIIGLILNGFTMIALFHPRMRGFSTNIYLNALSLANIFCLIYYLFIYSIRYIISYDNFKANVYNSHNKTYDFTLEINHNAINYENFLSMILWAASPIFLTFQLCSIYLTCAVTVDRWIYLLIPLKAERVCTIQRTLIAILSIFVFCVLFNLPRWFEVTYIKWYDTTVNRTIYSAQKTDFGNNKTLQYILQYYVYIIHVYGIPFIVLLIANIGIIHKLIQMKKRKTRLLGVQSKHSIPSVNGKNIRSPSTLPSTNIDSNNIESNNKNIELNTKYNNNYNIPTDSKNTATVPLLKSSSSGISVNNTNIKIGIIHRTTSNVGATPVSTSTATTKIDPKITVMVLAVVLTFFFCQFPHMMLTILSVKYNNKAMLILKTISNMLAIINCCTNFFVYCLFSKKFREISREILFSKSVNFYKPTNNRNMNTNVTKRRHK